MKIRRITAVLSLAAVMATSSSAFALYMHYNTHPNNHGTWTYGTTGMLGGDTVRSEYIDSKYKVSHSSVRNGIGLTNEATVHGGWAKSSQTAIPLVDDYAYYDFWN